MEAVPPPPPSRRAPRLDLDEDERPPVADHEIELAETRAVVARHKRVPKPLQVLESEPLAELSEMPPGVGHGATVGARVSDTRCPATLGTALPSFCDRAGPMAEDRAPTVAARALPCHHVRHSRHRVIARHGRGRRACRSALVLDRGAGRS